MSTQLSISTFVITDAIGGSGKDSISERELNSVRREKIMTQILGNPKDLITLSQVFTYNSFYIFRSRGHPRQGQAAPRPKWQVRLSQSIAQGRPFFLYP